MRFKQNIAALCWHADCMLADHMHELTVLSSEHANAGAIPFIALSPPIAQALPLLPAGLVANAALLQLGYGASIASFLGGVHWGMAMSGYGGETPGSSLTHALLRGACY